MYMSPLILLVLEPDAPVGEAALGAGLETVYRPSAEGPYDEQGHALLDVSGERQHAECLS